MKIADLRDASDLHGSFKSSGAQTDLVEQRGMPTLRRSSIEPTTILLRKQKYRLIGIGPFTCRAIAGALGRRA
jgi:hypothetical protein